MAATLTASPFAANAEDEQFYGQKQAEYNKAVDAQAQQQTSDQQYRMPQSYNGKYFPDDETAIGYHGTTRTSDNSKGNAPYYYYY